MKSMYALSISKMRFFYFLLSTRQKKMIRDNNKFRFRALSRSFCHSILYSSITITHLYYLSILIIGDAFRLLPDYCSSLRGDVFSLEQSIPARQQSWCILPWEPLQRSFKRSMPSYFSLVAYMELLLPTTFLANFYLRQWLVPISGSVC